MRGYLDVCNSSLEECEFKLQFFAAHGEGVCVSVALEVFVEGFEGRVDGSWRNDHASST